METKIHIDVFYQTLDSSIFMYFPILDLIFLYCPIHRQPMSLFYAWDQDLNYGALHFYIEIFAA